MIYLFGLQDSGKSGGIELQMGDVFSPLLEGVGEGFSSPKARSPLKESLYLVLETPYISNLQILLAEGLNRPITVFNKQMNALFSRAIENLFLPTVFVSIIISLIDLTITLR